MDQKSVATKRRPKAADDVSSNYGNNQHVEAIERHSNLHKMTYDADHSDYVAKTLEKQLKDVDQELYSENNKTILSTLMHYLLIIALLLATGFVIYIFLYSSWALPIPREADVPLNLFSEQRVRTLVHHMSETIGKRIVGSKANDIQTVEFILDFVHRLESKIADSRKNGNTELPVIEVDIQLATGAHIFSILDAVVTNSYSNITNIVVRLSHPHASISDNALLVNSHFDSTIGTQGASDAAVPICVMLETLRVFVHSYGGDAVHLKHPIIFLFNGAEESLQQASHAFITYHPWGQKSKLVVNLEACGAGGPEILFQIGSYDLLKAYAKGAPYPQGSSIANDIFSTGVIQSDTDYRIFKKYGNVVGMDMAYFRNSYVYHTPLDSLDAVEPGSIQHMGDNTVGIIKELIDSNLLDDPAHLQHTKVMFFDFLGLKMIGYSINLGMFLHFGVIGLFLFMAMQSNMYLKLNTVVQLSLYPLLASTWSVFLSFLAAILVPVCVGLVLTAFGQTMLWHNKQVNLIFLFGLPSVTAMLGVQYLYFYTGNTKRLAKLLKSSREWLSLLGVTLFYLSLLFLATVAQIGTSYLFFLWATFLTLTVYFNFFVINGDEIPPMDQPMPEKRKTREIHVSLASYLIAFAVPGIVTAEVVCGITDVFVPLTGRMGAFVWSDLVIGGLIGFSSALLTLVFIPWIHRAGNMKQAVKCLIVLSILGIAGVLVFGNEPYSQDRPKRLFLQHTHVVSPDTKPGQFGPTDESFILIGGLDARPTSEALSSLDDKYDPTPYPGLELWDSVYPLSFLLQGSNYVFPVEPYQNITPPSLRVLSDFYDPVADERKLHLEFNYKGSEWSTLRFEGDLVWWSVTPELPPSWIPGSLFIPRSRGNFYLLRHVGRHGIDKWTIQLTFRGQDKIPFFITATHFVKTEPLLELEKQFPEWTTVTSILTVMLKQEL